MTEDKFLGMKVTEAVLTELTTKDGLASVTGVFSKGQKCRVILDSAHETELYNTKKKKKHLKTMVYEVDYRGWIPVELLDCTLN